ncbi:MAG: DUF4287 domain-containing protein [Gemmatimonadetes bacterium]|nr:DUF4287 domain-containing protein [Gemmatimonadota bacterium]
MPDRNDPYATQLANIEVRTGRSLAELARIVAESGLKKHGEIRDMLKQSLGMGHGDANVLIHHLQASSSPPAPASADAADDLYVGPKADLRPIHDALMTAIRAFGDFEVAPKKGYVSLRRKKQFAMIGPTTRTRVDLGINAKELVGDARLLAMPPGGMCQYQVRLTNASEVTADVVAWVRQAYEAAG